MCKKENIKTVLKEKRKLADNKSIRGGHQARFLAKLNGVESSEEKPEKKRFNWSHLSIAASVVLLIGIGYQFMNKDTGPIGPEEVIELPEEIANAELYFGGLISGEIERLQSSKDEHTQELVEGALIQLQNLEKEYEVLQQELIDNYDRRIIQAMISNFQTRIDLLNRVMDQIEIINQLKNEQHESNI
ncbi:MAG: hypothetical protein HRT68_06430 [Flavobacteriaceae bacterium]|nr:hypothetical protein [Flavobacteriaceae bacterium]